MDLAYFNHIDTTTINQYLNQRTGETKLGQKIRYGHDFTYTDAQFVVLGISESIGVKGNLGIAGTHTAWESFMKSFVNVQHTKKLNTEQIMLLGYFDFQALYDDCDHIDDYRKATEKIDELVYPLIQEITAAGKTPIIIGGSHANAYPIIKGASLGFNKAISAINLDAHADFRALEGRHSGNPFSYAYQKNFLAKYAVIGLHENYNAQNMLNEMDQNSIAYVSWEDIYLRNKTDLPTIVKKYIKAYAAFPCGIELDLDAIQNTLSSAMGPSGFSVTEARQYAYLAAQHNNAAYLHLCEGSAQLENGHENSTTGKLLTYLATDFIKGYLEK